MPLLNRLSSLARNLLGAHHAEQDLDSELNAYLDQLTDRNVSAGMKPFEARRAARIEMGGIEQVKEEVRRAKSGYPLEEMLRDIRYGVRSLHKDPGFTLLAVLALALGIGATSAMFSVAYGLLLRPLPYPGASHVAIVCMRYYPRDFAFGTMCIRDFETWQAANRAFSQIALFTTTRFDLGALEGAPEQVKGALVTGGFFPVLQARPLLGRYFGPGEDQAASGSLVVIGESLWRRRFHAGREAVGRSILIGGAPHTIIGVMPDAFRFPSAETEAWANLKLAPATRYGPWFYRGLARLKPGVSYRQAQADTNAIGLRLMQQNPTYKRLTMPLVGLREWYVGEVQTALMVLLAAVALVLLVAVVNVANLVLARSTARGREMALRLSLGAARGRLVRQLLVESVLLAAAGGTAGTALAYAAILFLRSWSAGAIPLMNFVRLDARALLFTLAVSLLTGVLFGLYPALQSSRLDLHSALQEGGRSGSAGPRRTRTRSALVVAEIALSLVLLLGAGLFLRSFDRLQHVDLGFAAPTRRIVTMIISAGDRKYQDPRLGVSFYNEILRRATALSGIESIALSDSLPPDRQGDADTFGMEGQSLAAGEINPIVSDITVSAGYFRTLQVPLLRGREFEEHDTAGSTPVAIVSDTMARRFFPGRDPVGRRLRASGPESGNGWMEIVGVVGDVKYLGREQGRDSDAAYYLPLGQNYVPRMFLAARTAGEPSEIAAELRRQIQTADPSATVSQVTTMQAALANDMAEPLFGTTLLVLFAATALLMASVGIYGLISFTVARRTQEIGVRIALGARPRDVLRLVVRQAITLATFGIGFGLAASLLLCHLVRTLLFRTSATDPLTFSLVPLLLLGVVLLAALVPARRATRVSPVVALKYE